MAKAGTNIQTTRRISHRVATVFYEESAKIAYNCLLKVSVKELFGDDSFVWYIVGGSITPYATCEDEQMYRIKFKDVDKLFLLNETMARAVWVAEGELNALGYIDKQVAKKLLTTKGITMQLQETAGMDDLIREFLLEEEEYSGDSEIDVDVIAKDGYLYSVTATIRDIGTEYDLSIDTETDTVSWG